MNLIKWIGILNLPKKGWVPIRLFSSIEFISKLNWPRDFVKGHKF